MTALHYNQYDERPRIDPDHMDVFDVDTEGRCAHQEDAAICPFECGRHVLYRKHTDAISLMYAVDQTLQSLGCDLVAGTSNKEEAA